MIDYTILKKSTFHSPNVEGNAFNAHAPYKLNRIRDNEKWGEKRKKLKENRKLFA